MSGSIRGSGDGSVPDSKTTSANTPAEGGASNTPAEVNNSGLGAAGSEHGVGGSSTTNPATGGSSSTNPGVDSVPDTYQDVTEPADEDSGANRVSTYSSCALFWFRAPHS